MARTIRTKVYLFSELSEQVKQEEAIIETIEANEYEFTQDGKRF